MKILEKAKVEAAKNDVQAEIIYTQGEPHEILNTAKEKGVSLIVVGSRGHQRPERNDAW
ncbi:Universal stress protein family [Bacillus mojavensis]|uniref:Universal stress protein family n=1 Tax=Bacillus mojavensis TaxID=72360 RepID=A0ABX6M3N5_BACMO|nr:Universal stress protein family [Bacillus mojavensis]